MKNIPIIKLGLIAVSRDCFPRTLSESRRAAVCEAYGDVYECKIIVENETDAIEALDDVKKAGVNALVVYLGNFGPETSETLLAKYFDGPVMFAAAAESDEDGLIDGRGDAYCGMLNCSYNLGLRGVKAFIPESPVGSPKEIAKLMEGFVPFARAVIGLGKLKIISFGPRPQDFLACNAPIKQLYDIGVEIEENSELDLLLAFNAHADDSRITAVVEDMVKELKEPGKMADILPKLAQYELTLIDWAEQHKGSRDFVAFANKCWPAFQPSFGFVPCYVNSRLASRGMPVSCEVDIYGALSEYIGACVTGEGVTLLDINNTVPDGMYEREIKGRFDYAQNETFMGFHCGNTPSCFLKSFELKHQLIMTRMIEKDNIPRVTRGTLEGDIKEGKVTLYRLQGAADGGLNAYIAQGEVLPVATNSFGGIGVFAISEMGRFYRHVVIEGRYPHHGAVAFGHVGKTLFDVFAYVGAGKISYNRPKSIPYETENPF